jgi:hypothetical protein
MRLATLTRLALIAAPSAFSVTLAARRSSSSCNRS